jgi:Transposase DDE domain
MASVRIPASAATPTNAAPLPRLFAYAQALGLEAHLSRAKRGVSTLALALVWLTLAWRGTGRPERLAQLDEPLLAALLDRTRLPAPATLRRSLGAFSTEGVREAVEAAYRAELPRRPGRVWVTLDAHQVPYWGRAQRDRFGKGWAGNHGRRLRGYRLYLAVDTSTGQVITFVLAPGRTRDARLAAVLARRVRHVLGRRLAGVVADCGFTSHQSVAALRASGVPFILGFGRSAAIKARLGRLSRQQRVALRDGGAIRLGVCPWDPRLRLFALGARTPGDRRGPWVYVTSLRSYRPRRLATTYRQRTRVEQAIEELLNGNDLDHLVTYRLRPNRVALGFRLLARNLAIGLQIRDAGARPAVIREPAAFRATQVDGLGTFARERRTLRVTRAVAAHRAPHRPLLQRLSLPWTRLTVHLASSP